MIVETLDNEKLIVGLCGEYQLKNIATVLTAVEELQKLGFAMYREDVKNGLENVIPLTNLQGRWQVISHKPTVVLDTGHNKGGIENIVHQLKKQHYEKLRIVIGMVKDKDISGVLSLLPRDAVYYFTNAATERALPALKLKEQAERTGLNGKAYSTVEQAVKLALEEAGEKDFVFIGGSNFVVGEALPVFD